MVQADGHTIGVVATDDEVFANGLDFEAVNSVGKSLKNNVL